MPNKQENLAASILGKISAQARLKKLGKKGFNESMKNLALKRKVKSSDELSTPSA